MNKIVARQLQMINDQITGNIQKSGDINWNLLNAAAAAPYETNDKDYYIYRTLTEKAARLGCEITRLSPFKEQNELTALVASLTMLEINGCSPVDYKEGIDDLKSLFINNDISGAAQWLNEHTVTD